MPALFNRYLAVVVTAAVALFATATAASAHAPDEYGHNTYLSLGADGVRIEMHLTPGPLVGGKLVTIIDENGDGTFSDAEKTRYANALAADLDVRVDEQKRSVVLTSMVVPSPLDMRSGGGELVFTGIAAGPAVRGSLRFVDNHTVLRGQTQISLLSDNALPSDVTINRSLTRGVQITGTFTVSTGSSGQATTPAPAPSKTSTKRLQSYLGNATSFGAMAAALGIAALLGALHALTPGHGKTIAGAYLVGEQATVRHAIVLGSSVTITHTASVLVLGAVTIGLADRIDPTTLSSGLRWVSGSLVLVIGLTLLVRRMRSNASVHTHGPHSHSHHDHSHHDHSHHDHSHHGHPHHTHSHHDHLRDEHEHSDERPQGLRRLVALGASGGLVPCPEALGVLIVAVAVHRQVFGMAIIVSFSLGLASVLVGIGIALVRARSIVERIATVPEALTTRWLPIMSAAVVSLLGVAILSGHLV